MVSQQSTAQKAFSFITRVCIVNSQKAYFCDSSGTKQHPKIIQFKIRHSRTVFPYGYILNPIRPNLKPSLASLKSTFDRFKNPFQAEYIKKGAPEIRCARKSFYVFSFLCKAELAFKHTRPCVLDKRLPREVLRPYHDFIRSFQREYTATF